MGKVAAESEKTQRVHQMIAVSYYVAKTQHQINQPVMLRAGKDELYYCNTAEKTCFTGSYDKSSS